MGGICILIGRDKAQVATPDLYNSLRMLVCMYLSS